MFINDSTKEFNLVNNAIPSYDIAFEHLLYYIKEGCQCLQKIDNIFKNTTTYSIWIYQSFPLVVIYSFHSHREGDVE